ncbi:PYRUVATE DEHYDROGENASE E1 COMPONENT, ALPHA SUBUNIT [Mycoplasmopsis pulmonis]|uniref:Pyruvate dehydrogenase E1 component subunit alpha n=1 Tax=Mycoplasmopsis pulmonis (strain UAB CTIP) TaxID=272635 RepID=Q98PF9_MYCPU|nr:PYRUVATE DEHYDROGENASE E1 COMPONENT, ALPHA SUBUNIT [Mycoplasmopsis pulmonis]VEU68527.1 Pyruvate dehydrogenase E1 component subunit alpha [Mycoplasmopsis pulmonis]
MSKKFKYVDPKKVMDSSDQLIRVLDIDGKLIDSKYKTSLSNEKIIEAYTWMVRSRQQDTYMTQLQRQGRMLTFAPNFGEEALQVATSLAMEKDDWFLPAFRSNATMLHLGVPMINQMVYWNGNERGSKIPEGVNVLPVNVPIATQYSHAAGVAYGMKLLGKKNVAVTIIGNGGTAEGEFYEAMNVSSIHNWPVVFTVNNNQWSISTPEHLETKATIAAKAHAVGIPGVRVDGNDLLASYEVMKEAVEWAKEGNGPVLVEFYTWRQGVHTSSDNPRIYRTEEMEKEKEKWEPMHRIKNYMIEKGFWTEEQDQKLWEDSLTLVKETYEESMKMHDIPVDEVFDYTYEKLPPYLERQKAEAKEWFEKKGGK